MDGYGSRFIEAAFGVKLSTLHYWDKNDLIRPSVRPAAGRGSRRLYSFRDLVQLKAVLGLREQGIPLQRIRACVAYLRDNFPEIEAPLSEVALITDGETIFVLTADPDTVLDTLRGQFVFAVPVATCAREARSAITEMMTPRKETILVADRDYTYSVEQDPEDGWWIGFVEGLPGCGTQGRTLEELREMIADAIHSYLVVRGDISENAEEARQAAAL